MDKKTSLSDSDTQLLTILIPRLQILVDEWT